MDDRIRVSDADREQVTARLRDHFAEGRLSSDELDERITAALSAKTFGDLRRLMADLPDPAPATPPDWRATPPDWRAAPLRRGGRGLACRGPRLLPLALIVLIAALVIPGAGWLFLAFVKVVFVLWLVACVAGIIAAARFRRRARRYWQSGAADQWRQHQWRGGFR
jgi:hypothetical protein